MEGLKVISINRHRMKTDGNGVTTLVGLAGCPLKCKYCLNKIPLSTYKLMDISTDKLIDKLMIDFCYFVATGGGITFGGGEPLLQIDGLEEFYKRLVELGFENVKINLETSLNVDEQILVRAIQFVDLFIIDVKDINNEIYTEYTGKDNHKVLNNLRLLSDLGLQFKCKIRVPKIPDYNTDEDIAKTIEFIKELGFEDIDQFEYIVKDNVI